MSTPDRATGDRALLRFLTRQGRITADDATRLAGLLEEPGTTVHDVLEREGLLSQKDLALLLAETLRLRLIDLTSYPLDANVTRELKENIATRYEVVPIGIDERTIEVVTANPLDLEGLKAVEFATGKRVQAVVATHVEVKDALAHTYRLQESLEQFLQLVPAGESLVVNELSDDGADLRSVAADAELPPVIKLADKMLIEGIKSRASDIHVEPENDSVLVRYRVDGILEEAFRFPKWIQNPLVARLKVMAKLDITERRMPQDGRIQLRYQDKTVDLRVSSLPAQHGEKITLRILDASQAVKALERLGFGARDLKLIRDAAKKPQGMILITGPTGSGKTTTLYALLREILSPKTNIVTIENPIEYQLKGINQVEVNEKQGLTFGEVLRSVLRQDPDVILLGEIRDKETAQIAFQAATTGHLVLSTVHTNDAAGAVTRLMDLGLEPYAVSAALNLVVAQRLVRQLCPACSAPAELDDEIRRQLHLGDQDGTFKGSVGCPQCRHGGYRSRLGVYELLPMTNAITKLVEAGAGESMVRQQARNEGFHTLLEDAVDKLRAGLTSVEELQRVVQISDDTGIQCPSCKKEIADDYSVCPHCSATLRATCGGCAKPLSPEWERCPYCGVGAVDGAGLAPDVTIAPAERRSCKALVVDDTATIRDVVRHTLEHSDLGLTVLTAEDGPAALEIAGRERPDIVILDISMPGMDGFEVCRRLRSEMRTAFVPVLMLTAHGSEDDVARGFGVGADDYMVKPFRREGLVARVRRILERTYGSQTNGTQLTPDFRPVMASAPSGAAPMGFSQAPAPSEAAGVDVAAALAELARDRDAIRRVVESCETRIAELAARPLAPTAGEGAGEIPGVAALRDLLSEMQATQERALRELRVEAAHAKAMAEEALKSARAGTSVFPPAELAAMTATVERLQGEQVRLAATIASVPTPGGGVDEECQQRLRQANQVIEEMRGDVAMLRAAWQRDAGEIRAEIRASADEASQRAQAHTAGAVASLTQGLGELRQALETERGEQASDGARARASEERIEHAQAEALAIAEKTSRELAELRRAQAEMQDRRQQDAERLAGVEETARGARGEMLAAAERLAEELTTLRGTVAEQSDSNLQTAARLAGAEETTQQARSEMTTALARLGEDLAALQRGLDAQRNDRTQEGTRLADAEEAVRSARADALLAAERTERELAELRRLLAMHQAEGAEGGAGVRELHQTVQRLQAEAIAAAESVARAAQAETTAAAVQAGRELAELRGMVVEQLGTHQQQLQWLQARLGQARRIVVKLARRGRDVTERLAEVPSAAEHRAIRTSLDGCGTQLAEIATRFEAQDAARATADETEHRRLESEIAGIKNVTDRLGAEQGRLAADVEERLRGLMRTAAGGFDVQLALLRGKVEVLARTLRERVAVDPAASADEGLLEHRYGLLDRLREQLAGLQSSTDWRPQRVLELLVESTLAAAITPLRRLLELTAGESSVPGDRSGNQTSVTSATATITDESASPS